MRTYLALFILAGLLTLLLTPLIRELGIRLRAYGPAHEGREQTPIPRLGGLAIIGAALATWAALMLMPNSTRACFVSEWHTLVMLLLPATLVLALGVYDDLTGAKPWHKLLIEALAAGMIWWGGLRIESLPLIGHPSRNPLLTFLLTALWIVAVTNSFNLIDGMDGLASGVGFFVTLCVFIVSLIQQNYFICILAITLAGALLGFLRFNFVPASIFLGDTGSLFLGFVLATLAILTSQKGTTLVAIVVPYVAFGLPLLDTLLAVVRRFLSGRPLFAADRNHIHHRLLQNRLAPRVAVLALYGLAALFSLGSLLIIHSTGSLVALVAVLAGVLGWFLTTGLHYEELSEFNVYVSRGMRSQRRVLANQILIRKLARQLAEAETLESSWLTFIRALEALDFDGVTCELTNWQNGPAPGLAACSFLGENEVCGCWRVTIPLHVGEKVVGELQILRALNKERMLFQFSSLLDTLLPPFEKQLKRLHHAQEGKTGVKYIMEEVPAFPSDLLANGGK
jgi:UDP-GlcNAc:undecaprenyl-phosphate GlcNAc-1-phosphate transferase